jgi:hypothetical protein
MLNLYSIAKSCKCYLYEKLELKYNITLKTNTITVLIHVSHTNKGHIVFIQ